MALGITRLVMPSAIAETMHAHEQPQNDECLCHPEMSTFSSKMNNNQEAAIMVGPPATRQRGWQWWWWWTDGAALPMLKGAHDTVAKGSGDVVTLRGLNSVLATLKIEETRCQRYVLKDDHPYCIKCYEAVFANSCDDCSTVIGIDSKDLSYKDKHWHEKCFLCNKCQVSLVDKQFGSKMDKDFCGPCYDAQFATRCDGCGEIFRAVSSSLDSRPSAPATFLRHLGNKKMEYKARQWHEKCFCCVTCKTAIGTKSFIPRDQEIYCANCYEEKFATRCVKCSKPPDHDLRGRHLQERPLADLIKPQQPIITSGGVTYKNDPWHRECFTCTNCSASLAGQRFTSRDEKPYCADCFGELFAKRCTACSRPITGIGGTRFISFEDRHWHNDCFICASCNGSLVGKGFITDNTDILCPDCAKQKLIKVLYPLPPWKGVCSLFLPRKVVVVSPSRKVL
ncbi:Four and a half LIM domains protein 2 [Chionoecetes opilio]|uniref:Four and a half LIM domains protein 2 n=1 Tax=Chionoecetes opilio TaxID=41210 RepID=A0A8J5CZ43_CHIOP|nr:Four and a half LIM domains protein 2 [Chionoecetes opilio]